MNEPIYTFNGKNITMNVILQIRAVIDVLQDRLKIGFQDAMEAFYLSDTYQILRQTENCLWAESPEYIADRFMEEKGSEVE